MPDNQDFWLLVRAYVRRVAPEVAPPFISYAITTGDAPTTETVGSRTTSQVAVWLDGVPQTAENKATVTLPYGMSAPGVGELWLVLFPNYKPPGVLLIRIA